MRQRFFVVAALFLSLGTSVSAEEITHAEQYDRCMALVYENPNKAFDVGVSWKALGGGDAAEHCISSSMIGMRMYRQGAERLEILADNVRQTKEFKAQILAQAAQGWLLAKEYKRALAVLDTSINLDDTNPQFYVDRAQVFVARNHLKEALADLDKALEFDDMLLDALIFRGTVHRLMENFDAAWRDMNQAVLLGQNNQEAFLERGMLNRINGQKDKARKDWMTVIEIDPLSETADAARLNLEKMEVNPN